MMTDPYLPKMIVGIQLRVYDKSNGDPSATYELIYKTDDWEKDRLRYIKAMEKMSEELNAEEKD